MILVSPISELPILSEWQHCRQSDNRLTLGHPGNDPSTYLHDVGTCRATNVLATSMVGVRVGGEELGHQWIRGIGDRIVHGAINVPGKDV